MLGFHGDESVSSSSNDRENTRAVTTSESTVVEGRIVEVMESWPLQLAVKSGNVCYQIALLSETTVSLGGQPVNPQLLRPHQRIRVTGTTYGASSQAMVAQTIEVLK